MNRKGWVIFAVCYGLLALAALGGLAYDFLWLQPAHRLANQKIIAQEIAFVERMQQSSMELQSAHPGVIFSAGRSNGALVLMLPSHRTPAWITILWIATVTIGLAMAGAFGRARGAGLPLLFLLNSTMQHRR